MIRFVLAVLLAVATLPALAMDQSAVPPRFAIPWGNSAGGAYIRSIPQASQIGIQNCAASLTDGFPPLTFTPASAGGCPPFGQDFNGILKQVTQWNQWQAAGAPILWNASFSAAIGGYPMLARLANGAILTGSISGNTLTVTAISNGAVAVGQAVSGAGVTAGTVVTALVGGAGGVGTYTVNNTQTVGSEAMTSTQFGCLWVSQADGNTTNPGASGATWTNSCAVGGVLVGNLPNPTLAASGVAAGTYYGGQLTVGADGRLTAASSGTAARGLAPSALAFETPVNMQVNLSVNTGALTVAVVGVNGSALSAANPLLVGFRSQTLANGTNIFGQVTAPVSFTLASTSSMGCATGVTYCRLWGELVCQTESTGSCTAVVVGLSHQTSAATCYPLQENALQTTGIGTTGGTSPGVIWTSVSGLTGVAIRIAFYVEATWTSGTGWTLPGSPSEPLVHLFTPGTYRPCEPIQRVAPDLSAVTRVTFTVSLVSTNITANITPASAANVIQYAVTSTASNHTIEDGVQGVFYRGSTPIGGNVACVSVPADASCMLALVGGDAPTTTSAVTYTLKLQSYGGGTGSAPAVNNGGAGLVLEEIQGRLDPCLEPANDDFPLRATG